MYYGIHLCLVSYHQDKAVVRYPPAGCEKSKGFEPDGVQEEFL